MALATAHAAEDEARERFQAGVEAARGGDHETALEHFEAARDAGLDTAQLFFNIGVSRYRLGDYEEARRAFRRAAEDEGLRGLAYHNLGRVAEAQGREEEAADWYRRSLEAATTDTLRELNRRRLAGLEPAPEAPEPPRAVGLLELGAGYDSNVILASDEPSGDRDDLFGEVFGAGRVLLDGDWRDGWVADGTVDAVGYPDRDDFNYTALEGGVARLLPLGDWDAELGGSLHASWLGGDSLIWAATGHAHVARPVAGYRFDARYSLSFIDGASAEGRDFLDGFQQVLRLRLRETGPGLRWAVITRLEHNERDDLSEDDEFFSYSPVRVGLEARAAYPLTPRWELEGLAGFRHSRFSDREERADGSRFRRKDDRFELEGGARYDLGDGWSAAGHLRYVNNDSNADEFDYDRWVATGSLRWLF